MMRLSRLVVPLLSLASLPTAAGNHTLLPYVFDPLPLGSIKPKGWLRDTLTLMGDGLAGHEFDFYVYVRNSTWMGGRYEYSDLHESAPYWFNYIVPLAYGLDDARLKRQVRQFVEYVIAHQADDGWIGTETGYWARDLWARFPLMLGLTQLVEADPRYVDLVIPAMHRFFKLMYSMLRDDYRGYTYWGRTRSHDMIMVLQWMYENYPGENIQVLFDNMRLLNKGAYNWSSYFQEDVFPMQDLETLPVDRTLEQFEHGVNLGQALKSGAVIRRFTHNDALLESTRNGVNWTFLYHGNPSGAIIGDERISGLSPMRGTELCSVVETMFSLSFIYRAIGDRSFADRCERAAFNALPVMIMPDWWAHQYVSQTNQPMSLPLVRPPFWNVNNRGQTFGLEPHYPCCTTNHPQGYPKFLSASFVKVGHNGLGHALLSPSEVSTTLGKSNGNKVAISCETNYPFGNLLLYTIEAQRPFKFYVRVPEWYIARDSFIKVKNGDGGSQKSRLAPDPITGMHRVAIAKGRTTLAYKLGARIRIESRTNDTIAIHHGALLYALEIGAATSAMPPLDWRYQHVLPSNQVVPQIHDYIISNTTAWSVAIDPSTLRFQTTAPEYPGVVERLPNPIFQVGAPPTSITAKACEISWGYYSKGVPKNPPVPGMRNCTGGAFSVRLVPYGAAKIHIAEFPTVELFAGGIGQVGDQQQPLRNYGKG